MKDEASKFPTESDGRGASERPGVRESLLVKENRSFADSRVEAGGSKNKFDPENE